MTSYITLGAVVILVLALLRWPYDYYIFLRWAVSIAGILLVYLAYLLKKEGWMVALGIVVFVFNPLFPLRLERETWQILDLIGDGVFGLSFSSLRERESTDASDKKNK